MKINVPVRLSNLIVVTCLHWCIHRVEFQTLGASKAENLYLYLCPFAFRILIWKVSERIL
ncbi:hypothetical protein Gotur_026170 [Gossypium turneri]